MLVRRISIITVLNIFLLGLLATPVMAATTYQVKSGDSLYLISKKFGTSVKQLQLDNKLGSRNLIYPGQKLYISKAAKQTTTASARRVATTASRGGSQRGAVPYTADDVNLLARLITAEAGGESYQAQVAVGAVVLNRVRSPLFPNTIKGVIYQVENGHYQFTPVLNGFIKKPATAESLRAAKQALTGYDPTKGALYFFVTGTPNKFLNAKPVSAKIDTITFAL